MTVSPAQAGMDRWRSALNVGKIAVFPPHRRGWTVGEIWWAPFNTVSPAQRGWTAGLSTGTLRPSFPRTGGDGPQFLHAIDRGAQFPPHRRGWTVTDVITGLEQGIVRVSPAQAGMDLRLDLHGQLESVGFPRTGGDGP